MAFDRTDAQVAWDQEDDPRGNVRHVEEHDLSPDEVESVLLDPDATEGISRLTGHPLVRGYTYTGRYIVVIYDVESKDPPVIWLVTAYEPGD